jgi:uncharacterized protein (DUF58 family)
MMKRKELFLQMLDNWRRQLKEVFFPEKTSVMENDALSEWSAADIIKKVKKIELRSKLLSQQYFSGVYHSAFKGKGMQFSEVREYAYGDDIRHIDWNVSARMQSPYVKLFHEERQQTLMLLVDVSPSMLTSAGWLDRKQMVAEIAAALAYSAVVMQDHVGLLLFDDEVRKYLPPAKGHHQVLQIIRAIIEVQPQKGKLTDYQEAAVYLHKVFRRKAQIFLISDFLSTDYKDAIAHLSMGQELTGIMIKDPLDDLLPDLGLVQVEDVETGERQWVDTTSEEYRMWYNMQAEKRMQYFKQAFKESRSDALVLSEKDEKDYILRLQQFFHRKAARK